MQVYDARRCIGHAGVWGTQVYGAHTKVYGAHMQVYGAYRHVVHIGAWGGYYPFLWGFQEKNLL